MTNTILLAVTRHERQLAHGAAEVYHQLCIVDPLDPKTEHSETMELKPAEVVGVHVCRKRQQITLTGTNGFVKPDPEGEETVPVGHLFRHYTPKSGKGVRFRIGHKQYQWLLDHMANHPLLTDKYEGKGGAKGKQGQFPIRATSNNQFIIDLKCPKERPPPRDLSSTDEDLPARVAICTRLGIAFRHLAEWCGNVAKDFDQLAATFEDEPKEHEFAPPVEDFH